MYPRAVPIDADVRGCVRNLSITPEGADALREADEPLDREEAAARAELLEDVSGVLLGRVFVC